MPDDLVSIDEFLNARKDFVKSGDVLLKAHRSAPSSWDDKNRTCRFTMSAEVEDRDRDIVHQTGLSIDEFMKNPVAPLMHRSYTFPVGNWIDVEKNLSGRPKRTEGTLKLLAQGEDDDADRLAKHIKNGTIRACSIGFVPKLVRKRDTPEDKKDQSFYWPGYDIMEADLVECSPVIVPSNPAALAKQAADGDTIAREIIEEVLDNWVKTPAGVLMSREAWEAAQKHASGERVTVQSPSAAPVLPELEEPTTKSLLQRILDAVSGRDPEAELEQKRQADLAAAQEKAVRRDAVLAKIAAIDTRLGPSKT